MEFDELMYKVRGEDFDVPKKLLCLDPGHTTGWCVFENGILTDWGQAITVVNRKGNNEGDIDWAAVRELIEPKYDYDKFDRVVCEDYRVYAHKLDRHTNSQVLTLRIIGTLDYLCWANVIPIDYQMASVAKGFVTDNKLKQWGYWKDGMRHSRDAIRHGCYYLLFNKELSDRR